VLERDRGLLKSNDVDNLSSEISERGKVQRFQGLVGGVDKTDRSESRAAPSAAILLCTKDGDAYLKEQLDSIRQQSHANWRIVASDDGSSDQTVPILEALAKELPGRIEIRRGPQRGFCQNFLSLATDPAIQADYFAYCDQDDIWEKDKLTRALTWLETVSPSVPALYCARVQVVSADGKVTGHSPLFERAPSFRNALVQNIGSGNTMVFNRAARKLLIQAGRVEVVCHDWWTYQLVTACGGVARYDSNPTLKYRQHGENQIGSRPAWIARSRSLRLLLDGTFKSWNDANIRALQSVESILEPGNRLTLERFRKAREDRLLPRLVNLKRSGVYRQTLLSNLSLVAAVLFRKM
jgi:glycosyltransferase involved in cell wall biosynthesis